MDAAALCPAGGNTADLSALRLNLLCSLACQMFGTAGATIRVEGCSQVWHAGLPPTQDASPVASCAFGDGGVGRFSLFGPASRAFGADEQRQLEQFATLAQEQLRLYGLTQEALRRESDFRLLAEAATDTLVRGSLDGVRLYVSPSCKEQLGYEPHELVGHKANELTHPDDLPGLMALMQAVRAGRVEVGCAELRQRHKNGTWVWLEASLRLTRDHHTGEPDGYVVSVRDIGHRKRLEEQLKHLAEVDELTGLPNRAAFSASLNMAIDRARKGGGGFALFYMDLDGFKPVNDTFGHAAGDAVLRETARRLQASLREPDQVFRLGGDEFTILSSGTDGAAAKVLAQRLIAAITCPFTIDTARIHIGLSVGVAHGSQQEQEAARLLECADLALYCAKKAGKGVVRFYGADELTGA